MKRYSIFLFLLLLAGYLVYHMSSGKYSIFNWLGNEPEIIKREQHLQKLQSRRAELENLTSRLGDDALDLDLLEEEARRRLHYLEEGEVEVNLHAQ